MGLLIVNKPSPAEGKEEGFQGCPTFWCLWATLEEEELSWATLNTLWHVITKSSHNILSKFTILCWAPFTATLSCMWPAGLRLDTPGRPLAKSLSQYFQISWYQKVFRLFSGTKKILHLEIHGMRNSLTLSIKQSPSWNKTLSACLRLWYRATILHQCVTGIFKIFNT